MNILSTYVGCLDVLSLPRMDLSSSPDVHILDIGINGAFSVIKPATRRRGDTAHGQCDPSRAQLPDIGNRTANDVTHFEFGPSNSRIAKQRYFIGRATPR